MGRFISARFIRRAQEIRQPFGHALGVRTKGEKRAARGRWGAILEERNADIAAAAICASASA
jgi:hypothetical protein